MQLHPKHLPEYSFSCFPPFLISLSIAFVSFLLHLSAPLLERNLQSLRGIQFATLSAHLEAIRIASSQNSLHHAAVTLLEYTTVDTHTPPSPVSACLNLTHLHLPRPLIAHLEGHSSKTNDSHIC
ncbi:uncharacterized protein CLUP02_07826 [Colletotrichum lupini]|uniref:Uncharacterized protein n=1 Tax=Colletotrichum lupini TaxID=145971 RepID=A0A9Q8SSB7_9PEZI|nr:uncharacterized protein CLUP02_07826 [Colletotrichum lupini]UQC82338.1 hypothetical protein CLUP02_07826 [Colletotrichum lupini]